MLKQMFECAPSKCDQTVEIGWVNLNPFTRSQVFNELLENLDLPLYEFRLNWEYKGKYYSGLFLKSSKSLSGLGRRETAEDLYEGQIQNAIYHGYGRYSLSEYSTYEGQYLNGKKHGQGR